jgi:hydroxymethylpyrimidine/phosphomethylpyrimidine kinase
MIATALTIAGSDPSGGAGIQADLKTFHQRGVYGTSVITLLTVQNSEQVQAMELVSSDLVAAQLDAVLGDIPPAAAKTGALGGEATIRILAAKASEFRFPLVVDPVMVSKHGASLLPESAWSLLAENLVPHACLVTPNLREAGIMAQMEVHDLESMKEASKKIADLGPKAVLVKGGHLEGAAVDILYWNGEFQTFTAPRIDTRHTHGTGCTYSAAITAELAKGNPLTGAVETAKRFITRAIETNPGLGRGQGPVNHHATID